MNNALLSYHIRTTLKHANRDTATRREMAGMKLRICTFTPDELNRLSDVLACTPERSFEAIHADLLRQQAEFLRDTSWVAHIGASP